jgi:hypothetical protein
MALTSKTAAGSRAPAVHMLRATPIVDTELGWFFNRVECDMGIRSNFHAALSGELASSERVTPEDAAEALRAQRTIRGWLLAIPDTDAGVLQSAYEQRDWPASLVDELGRITGVVVRLACALDPWPADRAAQRLVEMGRAHWLESHCSKGRGRGFETLLQLRREGEVRFAKAHHAYAVVRGHGPCLARST